MRTKTISAHLIRSYHCSSPRNHLPSACPVLQSSFPKLTSVHQHHGATSALPLNHHPANPAHSFLPVDAPFRNINPPPGVDPTPNLLILRPGRDFMTSHVPSSMQPEVPGEPPQGPDMPVQPPTYEPGRTPPGVEPPTGPPEITPNVDPLPGIDPTPEMPIPSPGPDLPSPPIPSPSKPEIPGEPRNPEIPIPPPSPEPGYVPPGIDPPKAPPEITLPSPPEIIPPQIF